jgi:predicted nucleic acid-binding protein
LNGIFIDTSGWANLFVKTEPWHEHAVRLIHAAQTARRRSITTNYVLAELSALLMSPLRVPRESRLRLLDRIRSAGWVEVLHVSPAQDEASWAMIASWHLGTCVRKKCGHGTLRACTTRPEL